MRYRGVFFDFDYTLGDSTVPITIGYQKGFEAMGWPPPTAEQVRPTIGMTLADGYTALTGDSDPARQLEFYERFQDAVGERAAQAGNHIMEDSTRLFPGAEELIRTLRDSGIHVAVVSTKLGSTLRRIFRLHGLDGALDLVVGGEEVSHPKPHPEGLERALSMLSLSPEQVLYCGDTVIDAATAQNGGTCFCAVLNGTTPASAFEAYPHVHIAPDLTELRTWLEL